MWDVQQPIQPVAPPLSPVIVAPRLRQGDVVGLITPASAVTDPSRVEQGTRYLERIGFHVKLGAHVGNVHGYLGGTDEDRASDIHHMLLDPHVKALFTLRGGYGVTRILPRLDFTLFRRHPKIIAGYSDITALLLAVFKHASLVTFHGPMVAVDFAGTVDQYTEGLFWDMLRSPRERTEIIIADADTRNVLREGRARGRLLGGNLSLLTAMVGTPHLPDFNGSILFVEETGEEPYRVDRMFTQLLQSGVLNGVVGILGGQFTDCEPKDHSRPSLSITDVLHAVADELPVPFIAGCRFGHVASNLTLPVGILAEVDTDRSSLTLLEPAVSSGDG